MTIIGWDVAKGSRRLTALVHLRPFPMVRTVAGVGTREEAGEVVLADRPDLR